MYGYRRHNIRKFYKTILYRIIKYRNRTPLLSSLKKLIDNTLVKTVVQMCRLSPSFMNTEKSYHIRFYIKLGIQKVFTK